MDPFNVEEQEEFAAADAVCSFNPSVFALRSNDVAGAVVPIPTFPAGDATVPVIPVAKRTLPIFKKLLVGSDGTSTALLVPIRILPDPVLCVVLATLSPSAVLLLPVVFEKSAAEPLAVL